MYCTVIKQKHWQRSLSCLVLLTRRKISQNATEKKCYYDVLGLNKTATRKEIRSAYVSKTKELHPDKDISDPELHDLFVEVNEAYTVLGNNVKKAEYDNLKTNMTRIKYKAGYASTDNPFGNVRDSHYSHSTQFDPKFQGFSEDEQYTESSKRDFEFAKEKYRGERSSANKYIISAALAIMAAGAIAHYFQINFIRRRFEEYQEKVQQETSSVYNTVRQKAKLNGPRKQLQLLASSKEFSDSSKDR
ncbi:dnaJ homolog subfamily C member 4-like [Rhopilema esculentum]|uniref:dnaJ homolog subfamily C member 4-like n=1 Tax=Rhopilema esculentum TaxID=499914 RepID=UPI0031D07647